MSFIKELTQASERSYEYIKFNDLEKGRYNVRGASVSKKMKFDDEKHLVLHLDQGCIMLPHRFNYLTKIKSVMANLNMGRTIMVYKGKDPSKFDRLLIEWEESTSDSSSSEEDGEGVEGPQTSEEGMAPPNKRTKRNNTKRNSEKN